MTLDCTRDVTLPGAQFVSRLFTGKHRLDLVIGLLLAGVVFALYARTLVPSVLDGDQGELQFMPAVLGIPHPSGFPLYLLIGHLWSALPIGSLAYRMNMFSAIFGALTIGALYLALRSQKLFILAALGASFLLAILPQFWEYSTVAAVYRLHDFLIVLLFAFLAQWERTQDWRWLNLAALAFGLDLANHLTILFFGPAIAVLLLTVSGRKLFEHGRAIAVSILLLLSPLLLYLYFPLRGLQILSNNFALPGWNMAVAQGIVSPFFDSTPTGLFNYFVGGTFFKSVTGHLEWKWDTLLPDWWTIVLQTVNWEIVILSILGLVFLAKTRAKLATWLVLVVVMFQVIALQYSYAGLAGIGQFSSYFREYYLPSFIAMIILAAWGIDGALRVLPALLLRSRIRSRALVFIVPAIAVTVFLVFAAAALSSYRSDSLAARSSEIQAKWDIVKEFPPEQGAALVGHWGDLTPLWYYQYAENWRPDLVTINPPDDGMVNEWLATGKPLYVAGSLLDWAPGIARTYHLTPWGNLVRVTPSNFVPASPLAQAADWTFQDDRPVLKLSGYGLSRERLPVGENLTVDSFWQVINAMRLDDFVVYLSLASAQDDSRPQSNAPVVNWFPGASLQSGQRALSTYHYMVPWGTAPGTYRLRLSVYEINRGKNLTASSGGESLPWVDLGPVVVQAAASYPETAATDHPAYANFGNSVILLGWDGDLGQLTQGDTPSIEMLWKLTNLPQGNLTAALSLDNAGGTRSIAQDALSQSYPVLKWVDGEIVRGARSFTIPADLPDGDYSLTLRVQNGDSTKPLALYDGWFPHGDSYILAHVHIVGRKHSFAVPAISHRQTANFDGKIQMLGYDLGPNKLRGGDSISLSLFWQGLSLMDRSYKFFVHVIDGQGKIVAQHDDVPGGGALPTTGWLPREVITDSFEIPLPDGLAAGTYQVQVGYYDATTGARLNLTGETGVASQDYLILDDTIGVTNR